MAWCCWWRWLRWRGNKSSDILYMRIQTRKTKGQNKLCICGHGVPFARLNLTISVQLFLLVTEMKAKRMLVQGVGVNDAPFPVAKRLASGRSYVIGSYRTWANMLSRCYGKKYLSSRPTYHDCIVCTDWHRFMSFNSWYIKQYKEDGWHLDKDIISPGNREYSPELCAFVPQAINVFLTDHGRRRGRNPIGVVWHKTNRKFVARCSNPFTGKIEHLGYFDSENDAFHAWKLQKHRLACRYADTINDKRVSSALRVRYL